MKFSLLMKARIHRAKMIYRRIFCSYLRERRAMESEFQNLFHSTAIKTIKAALQARGVECPKYREEQITVKTAMTTMTEIEDNPTVSEALEPQLSPKAKSYCADVTTLKAEVHQHRQNRDEAAIEHHLQRLRNHEAVTCEKLRNLLTDISHYQNFVDHAAAVCDKFDIEEKKCRRNWIFASELGLLGAPMNFFRFPPELRNMIYGEVLGFTETLSATIRTLTPKSHCNDKEALKHFEKIGTFRLWKHPLFSVSSQVRSEAAAYFYGSNAFTCRSLYTIQRDLGLKALAPQFRNLLKTINFTWTNLGDSTVIAVNVLKSLAGLKTVNLYINWVQVHECHINTRDGVDHFKSLLALADNTDVQIHVFEFKADGFEQLVLAMMNRRNSRLIEKGLQINAEGRRKLETLLYGKFSDRLIATEKPSLEAPVYGTRTSYYKGEGLRSQDAVLMKKEDLSERLEAVIDDLRVKGEEAVTQWGGVLRDSVILDRDLDLWRRCLYNGR